MRAIAALMDARFTAELVVLALLVSGLTLSALVLLGKHHARHSMREHLDQKHRDRMASVQRAGRRAQQAELARLRERQEEEEHLAQIRLWRETHQEEQP